MKPKTVKKSRSFFTYIGIALSIIILVFISGCTIDDIKTYSIAEEQYLMGWILHNINDSTETTLDYSLDELAIYNYTFNYPSTQPQTYSNLYFWVVPMHKNARGAGAAASWMEMDVPLNRVYYLKGGNAAPENYETNWSFSTYTHINYLESNNSLEQFALEVAHVEHYRSENAFRAITPIPGDKKNIYFGTAPFTPTSVIIEDNYIKLKDHLMKGYGGKSYLLRDTEVSVGDLMTGESTTIYIAVPTYQIYLGGSLKQEGNLTGRYKTWNYSALNYNLSEDGNYLVNITIPTNYPVWNTTIITAQFNKPSLGMNPPILNHIEVSPRLVTNELLPIIVNVTDDSGINNVSIFYKTDIDNNWLSLTVTSNYPLYNTSLLTTNSSVNEIYLKLFAEDNNGNNVKYTILPVSLKNRIVDFNLKSSKISAKKVDDLWISGNCIDNLGLNCGGLRIKYYLNDDYLKADRIERDATLSSYFTIPYDFTTSQANFSVVFDGTGIYSSKKETVTVDIITHDHDLTIGDLTLSSFKLNQQGNVNTTVYNIGYENETDVTIKLLINDEVIDSISIPGLNSNDFEKISFNWTPTQPGKYVINVSVDPVLGEVETENNYRISEVTLGADLRTSLMYQWGTKIIVNQTTEITTNTVNIGDEDANNVTISLIDSTENLTIGRVNISTIHVDEAKTVEFNWTPSTTGYHELELTVNCTDDADLSNNYYINWLKVLIEAPDVSGYIEWYWNQKAIVNETNEVPIEFSNYGTQPAENLTAIFYDMYEHYLYFLDYNTTESVIFDGVDYYITASEFGDKIKFNISYDGTFEEFSLVHNGIVVLANGIILDWGYFRSDYFVICLAKAVINEKDLPDLQVDEYKTDSIDWVPNTTGDHRVKLFVNVSNDGDWVNNYNSIYIEVLPEAPDVIGYILWGQEPIVNHTTNTTVMISNGGILDATDTWAAFYVSLPNGTEILIENKTIGYLKSRINSGTTTTPGVNGGGGGGGAGEVSSDIEVNFTWTPGLVGGHMITLIVGCTDDWNIHNNEYSSYLHVKSNTPDIHGHIYRLPGAVLNRTINITADVYNGGGKDAYDVLVSLYNILPNNTEILMETVTIDELAADNWVKVDYIWTPDVVGTHGLKLIINCTDDWSLADNEFSIFVDVAPEAPDVTGDFWVLNAAEVNKTVYTTVGVINIGGKNATNVTADLYDHLPNNTKVKIWNTTVDYLSSVIEWPNSIWVEIEWKPDMIGYHTLELIVNCTDDWNPGNNVYDREIFVYEPMNVTFYLTDHTGGFTDVALTVQNYLSMTPINISQNVSLPDVEKLDIGLLRFAPINFAGILLWNSTMNQTMEAVFEHHLGKIYSDNLVLHSVVAYNTLWDYESATMIFSVVDYDFHDSKKTSIYICSEWNWNNEKCNSEWSNTDSTHEWQGYYYDTMLFSDVSSTNAFALAEPQFCGDDYCSLSESCSSCSEDCGSCPTGDDGGDGGGPVGGGVTEKTYVLTEERLVEGFTKELSIGDRFKFTLEEEAHYVTVDSVTSTAVKINVTSETQQATLSVEEEQKFELTGDNYYDLSVKVNSIDAINLIADITIKKIQDVMPVVTTITTVVTTTTPIITTTTIPERVGEVRSYVIIIVIALMSIVMFVFITNYIKRKRKIAEEFSITPSSILKYSNRYIGKNITLSGDIEFLRKVEKKGNFWHVLRCETGQIHVLLDKKIEQGSVRITGKIEGSEKYIFIRAKKVEKT